MTEQTIESNARALSNLLGWSTPELVAHAILVGTALAIKVVLSR